VFRERVSLPWCVDGAGGIRSACSPFGYMAASCRKGWLNRRSTNAVLASLNFRCNKNLSATNYF
jgi:hypothetical protein